MGDWGWHHLQEQDKQEILRGLEDGTTYGGPYHVELQPSDRCDIDCYFCSTRHHRTNVDLPLAVTRSLVRQMESLGVYSVTLCGGGEPLVFRHILPLFEMLHDAGIAVDHLTTNGTCLFLQHTQALLGSGCREIIISLNSADPREYAATMRTTESTFHRVVDNVRQLISLRKTSLPHVVLQFMTLRENFRDLERMYDLADGLGVDGILFREPAFLPPECRLSEPETTEMIGRLGDLLCRDGFRLIRSFDSFDRVLSPELAPQVNRGIHAGAWGRTSRNTWRLLTDPESTWAGKWDRFQRWRHRTKMESMLEQHGGCIAPWHTMTVRADGSVPVCCVLQTARLGWVHGETLEELWHGEPFHRIRQQMRQAMTQGSSWSPANGRLPNLSAMCGWSSNGVRPCIFRNFYYGEDYRFVHRLHRLVTRVRERRIPLPPTGTPIPRRGIQPRISAR